MKRMTEWLWCAKGRPKKGLERGQRPIPGPMAQLRSGQCSPTVPRGDAKCEPIRCESMGFGLVNQPSSYPEMEVLAAVRSHS
eukprot:3517943-Amphidinium_carterae.2